MILLDFAEMSRGDLISGDDAKVGKVGKDGTDGKGHKGHWRSEGSVERVWRECGCMRRGSV